MNAVNPSVRDQASRPRAVVAIDASRNRSGGARTHLFGILTSADPREFGIDELHVWSYSGLLDMLPEAPWLVKHNPPALERSLPAQLWWQYRHLPDELRRAGCNVLLTTDAGSVCRFRPSVVMSRDMLSFEGSEMYRYPTWSFARMRLLLLRYMQVESLRKSSGALFLTHYASEVIGRFTGPLPQVRVIPHGIGENFRSADRQRVWPETGENIRCVYVSNADLYKHQWHVVDAVARLRSEGHPVSLTLIGGGSGPAKTRLDEAVARHDAAGRFVTVLDAVAHGDIPAHLAQTDLFVFASSCENMPNTLVEGMAAGLPIACSNRGPMPEILQDAGVYFDPEEPAEIADAIRKLLVDEDFRGRSIERARELSDQYSWSRCARETWTYLSDVLERAMPDRPALQFPVHTA